MVYNTVLMAKPGQIGRSGRLIDLMFALSGCDPTSMPSSTVNPGRPTTLVYAQLSVSDGQPRATPHNPLTPCSTGTFAGTLSLRSTWLRPRGRGSLAVNFL